MSVERVDAFANVGRERGVAGRALVQSRERKEAAQHIEHVVDRPVRFHLGPILIARRVEQVGPPPGKPLLGLPGPARGLGQQLPAAESHVEAISGAATQSWCFAADRSRALIRNKNYLIGNRRENQRGSEG